MKIAESAQFVFFPLIRLENFCFRVQNSLYQIEQVKMTCRVNPFQLDAYVIDVYDFEDTIPYPVDQRIDIRSNLALEVGNIYFELSPVDEDQLEVTTIDSSLLGSEALEYSRVVDLLDPVSIGDY